MGVDCVQGYLIGEPRALETLAWDLASCGRRCEACRGKAIQFCAWMPPRFAERAAPGTVRPELVEGPVRCSGGVRRTADRWPGVARRQVPFFVSPKKGTKERRPRQSRIPEDQARRAGGKELAPLLL